MKDTGTSATIEMHYPVTGNAPVLPRRSNPTVVDSRGGRKRGAGLVIATNPRGILDCSSIVPRLVLDWCSIGARLVFNWCSIGARLVLDWCSIGARLVTDVLDDTSRA